MSSFSSQAVGHERLYPIFVLGNPDGCLICVGTERFLHWKARKHKVRLFLSHILPPLLGKVCEKKDFQPIGRILGICFRSDLCSCPQKDVLKIPTLPAAERVCVCACVARLWVNESRPNKGFFFFFFFKKKLNPPFSRTLGEGGIDWVRTVWRGEV